MRASPKSGALTYTSGMAFDFLANRRHELVNCTVYSNAVFYRKNSKSESKMPRTHGSYSTSDLSSKSGDIIAEALRHPVTITQRNKPRLVLLNIEDYERLMRQSDVRSVGTIETMSDELFDEFERAVDNYVNKDETRR